MLKILAIDDNINQLIIIEKLVKKHFDACVFLQALSGNEGFEIAVNEIPDIILLDILMPDIDGFETCSRLKGNKTTGRIPVVFLSAVKSDLETRIKVIKSGANAFLLKPIDELELVLQIKAMLAISEAQKIKDKEFEKLEKLVDTQTNELTSQQMKNIQTEKLLREKESMYQSLVESSPDILYVYSTEKGATFWSKRVEEILQFTPADLIENPFIWTNAVAEQDKIKISTAIKNVKNGKCFDIEYRIKDKSGDWHWLRDRCISKIQNDDEIIIQGLATDITKEKQAVDKQIQTNNFLTAVLENIPGSIWIIDENYRMVMCNTVFRNNYNKAFNTEISVGDYIMEFVTDEEKEKWSALYKRAFDGDNYIVEYQRKYTDVETWSEFLFSPVLLDNKKKKLVLILSFDITDRIRTKKRLEENEKNLSELNATKDKFFSIIAHDLKSPFNSILGFSDLIQESVLNSDYDQIALMSKMLNKAARQSYDLLNNLLEWSRTQRGKSEFNQMLYPLTDIINSTVNVLSLSANQKNIKISLEIDEVMVFADYNMIESIIRNLISNAIKYTYEKGVIEIRALEKEHEIEISVSDNGMGMKKEIQEKLFNIGEDVVSFGTNNEKGTGLGLLLCKEFVKAHKGKIWFESEPGFGTTFFVSFPKIKG